MTDQPLSYWIAVARMGFEEDFNRLFEEMGITRAELAERLGASPAYVSKILNGKTGNFQLETLTKLARAIDAILQIRLIKGEGEVVRVVDYETARALDDAGDASREREVLASSSNASTSKVIPFEDRRKSRGTSVERLATGSEIGSKLGSSMGSPRRAEEFHG